MRIRKAEKLLGFASESRAAPSPPTPWDSAAAMVAAAELLCEMNRSSCLDDSIDRRKEELDYEEEEDELENKAENMTGEGWNCNPDHLSSCRARLKQRSSGDGGGRANRRRRSAAAVEAGGMAPNYCYFHPVSGIDSRENGEDDDDIDGGNLCNFKCGKKMRPPKKRGRKPMKARSLKSSFV